MTGQQGQRSGYWRQLRQDKRQIIDVRADEARREGTVARAINRAGRVLSHPLFFAIATLLHALWVVLNVPAISPIEPFDPAPFMLLATIASVEAPLLALLILMRQQQDARVAELREETSLQVALHDERETTKLLTLMMDVHRKLGIEREPDPDLDEMLEPLDPERLLHSVESSLEADEEEPGQAGGSSRPDD